MIWIALNLSFILLLRLPCVTFLFFKLLQPCSFFLTCSFIILILSYIKLILWILFSCLNYQPKTMLTISKSTSKIQIKMHLLCKIWSQNLWKRYLVSQDGMRSLVFPSGDGTDGTLLPQCRVCYIVWPLSFIVLIHLGKLQLELFIWHLQPYRNN